MADKIRFVQIQINVTPSGLDGFYIRNPTKKFLFYLFVRQ